jgi:hypothetical protein
MTQEEKELLLKDLCARLPYGVKVHYTKHPDCTFDEDCDDTAIGYYCNLLVCNKTDYCLDRCKPYLRPMSNMTEEEKKEFIDAVTWEANGKFYIDESEDITFYQEKYDWLNKKMFDYRGLIEKGSALEAPEGMY